MSSFLETMLARAKADRQTIVLPEGDDERTLAAAERILAEGVANLVILGDAAAIEASPYALDDARIVDVRTAACSVRSSSPSGSTIVCRSSLARASMESRNALIGTILSRI